MKLAICKVGANITFSSQNKSAANADILYFLRQLDIGEHDVTICTHKTRNTVIPKRMQFLEVQDATDFDSYDLVIVFNGSYNFFGGACDPNLLALYKALHFTTDTPIVWANTDGQCQMKHLWPLIEKREWAQNLQGINYAIPEDQVVLLTQGRNAKKINAAIKRDPKNIQIGKIAHAPFYEMILAKHEKYIKPNPVQFKDRTYDLGFGGATRNAYKRKRIEHYYDELGVKTLLFGNLRGVNTRNAEVHGKVSYQDFIRMMWRVKGTVIIGDEYYEDNFFTLRMYESLLADNIMYIDNRLDTKRKFYPDNHEMYIGWPHEADVSQEGYEHWTDIRQKILSEYNYRHQKERLVATLKRCASQ